ASCDSGDASKSWSTFATCLAGPAAGSPLVERAQKLRQYQLGNPGAAATKDGWPKRCAASADDLYASLDKSGKTGLMKRKLHERLGCSDQKGSCTLPTDGSLLTTATELWESAKSAELKLESVQGVAAPTAAPPPVVDAKGWKSFSAKPLRMSGPVLTSDGRAVVVLKPTEGRARPIGCEFSPSFDKVRCLAENSKIPELPPQSIDVVSDSKGVYAAGITEQGLVAYNLETGETSPVGGRAGRLVREGAVVDRAAKEDISGEQPSMPTTKAGAKALSKALKAKKAAPKDEGYVVRELAGNKASKEVPLKIPPPVGDPLTIGNQIVFLTPKEGGTNLVVMSVAHGRASAPRTLEGAFTGTIHTCRRGDDLAVAVFGGRKDQGRAQATAGEGKTAVTVALFRKGTWSKAAEATLPFERATESELTCTANGASITYAQKSDGGATVGRIDCAADGCKTSEAKLGGIEPIYFWATGALGEKTLFLYRSTLGETRLRVASLSELANAKDTIVFDGPDFGGPTTGELLPVLSDSAALLIFRGEQPVALRVGAEGTATIVAL
ncbi:MAG TPA: hypothetical protein VF103_01220, partial [Polyangiaceae bacterium]